MVNEEQINSMSFVFFESVLTELGHKLNFDAVVNYAGNSFFEKSWQLIAENNPFNVQDARAGGGRTAAGLASFFDTADIKIMGG